MTRGDGTTDLSSIRKRREESQGKGNGSGGEVGCAVNLGRSRENLKQKSASKWSDFPQAFT